MADSMSRMGSWAFVAGVLLALLAGLIPGIPNVMLILVVLGVVVGLLNVTTRETTAFLVASVALLLPASATSLGAIPTVGVYMGNMLANIASFVAPAAVIVALRAIVALASEE